MSLSNLCFEQHEQDQVRLRKLLLWGLLGSVGVHAIALGLSQLNLWPNADETDVLPIELIVTEPPVETPETEVPDPTQPAELSTEINDPAPAAQAPSPRAAVVTAPQPVSVVEPDAPETATPELLTETAVESALEVPEDEAPPAEPEAEPTEPDLATAPENPSQFDRLRDLLRRRREGEAVTEAAAGGSPDSDGPPAPDSTGAAETTAARNGNGQGQGSRTVACQNCVRPDYPQSALDAGAEGQPMVSVNINPDGSVHSVTLTRSSGNPAIDQAAIQAARNSRFQPVSGGASVPIEYDLTIEGSRRNRDARRRGDRQSVELPPESIPTPETATVEPNPEPTAMPTQPVDAAEPAAAPPPPADSEPESAGLEPVEAEPAPASQTPVQSLPASNPPVPSALPTPIPATPSASPPAPVAPSSPTPPSPPPADDSAQPDASTTE